MHRSCRSLLVAGLLYGWARVSAKRTVGEVSLGSRQSKVVTKFCFDFNPDCPEDGCAQDQYPGINELRVFSMRREDGLDPSTAGGAEPEVYIAMLDDEYFSFPELSHVWGEANCSDVRKAAKKSIPVDWSSAQTSEGWTKPNTLKEKIRPRWWYVAIVSCSDFPLVMKYDLHLTNQLQGWQKEFSVDSHNVIHMSFGFSVLLAGLCLVQWQSMNQWAERSKSKRWMELHPALLMVTSAAGMALFGMAAWFLYFWHIQASGEAETYYDVAARGFIMSAKTVMQVLFMLHAQGNSICSPQINWGEHQELIFGMIAFGILSFVLEVWSDSEFWSTTTEYVYDTRPGIALVAFDVFWLWMYASRCYKTFKGETHAKARAFYRSYAPIWGCWYASLPLVAIIGRVLSPWVRHRIIFAVTGLAHVGTLAALVHSFRPEVAVRLYDLKLSDYEPVLSNEEAKGLLDEVIGNFGSSGSSKMAAFDIDDDIL